MPETGKSDAAAKCDICGGFAYTGELVHLVDGYIVCADCFWDFAFDYFEDRLMPAEETACARRISEGEDKIDT